MTMHDDAKVWLLDWFQRRNPAVALDWQRDSSRNYFDAGWTDSFGAIQLVDDMEQRFQVRFSEADLNDERFGSMRGLADLLERQKSGAG